MPVGVYDSAARLEDQVAGIEAGDVAIVVAGNDDGGAVEVDLRGPGRAASEDLRRGDRAAVEVGDAAERAGAGDANRVGGNLSCTAEVQRALARIADVDDRRAGGACGEVPRPLAGRALTKVDLAANQPRSARVGGISQSDDLSAGLIHRAIAEECRVAKRANRNVAVAGFVDDAAAEVERAGRAIAPDGQP